MSIRLAASKPFAQLRYSNARMWQMRLTCANDNASAAPVSATGTVLHAALRHFAVHGLAAAQQARAEAEAALAGGDENAFAYWHGICHTLDRRLASTLDRAAMDRANLDREYAGAPR